MPKLLLTPLTALFLLLAAGIAQAQKVKPPKNGDMSFTRLDVSWICADCSVVQATGEFTQKTMDVYYDFVWRERFKKNIYFVFDSRGGTMRSAMELGMVLRRLKVNTMVGRATIRNGAVEIEPANCASACVMTYVGGVTRSMPKGSRLGVHRWIPIDAASKDGKPAKNSKPRLMNEETVASLQKQVAIHLKYFQSMDIDLRVAIPMLETPYSGITWVSSRDQSLWSLVTIDSKLSTPADRRWPVIFLPTPEPAPGQDKPLSGNRTAEGDETEALPSMPG
jgi:hypothetical protein